MSEEKNNKALNQFLNKEVEKPKLEDNETEICDNDTGECYTLRSKDGIVERINKKYITDDGRQLLQD